MKKQSHVIATEQDRAGMVRFLQLVSLEKPLIVTVEERRKKRSLSQNALYWKWMEEAGNALGYDKDDMHEACKQAFGCPATGVRIGGKAVEVRTTSKLETEEMNAYMDRCYRGLAEMGCYLTLPEEAFA